MMAKSEKSASERRERKSVESTNAKKLANAMKEPNCDCGGERVNESG